jgi:hypothetical protein
VLVALAIVARDVPKAIELARSRTLEISCELDVRSLQRLEDEIRRDDVLARRSKRRASRRAPLERLPQLAEPESGPYEVCRDLCKQAIGGYKRPTPKRKDSRLFISTR